VTAALKRRLHVGDYVRERDGTKRVGVITHMLHADPDLLVVLWPPSSEGLVYHRADLVKA
jgi:hypothetical protein